MNIGPEYTAQMWLEQKEIELRGIINFENIIEF